MEINQINPLLSEFLDGKYSVSDFMNLVEEYIQYDFSKSPSIRRIIRNDLQGKYEIPVEGKHLINMLNKYIEGEINGKEISDWSAIIFLSRIYRPSGANEEEIECSGEGPTWDILQRLMSPDLFDGLNIVIANKFVREISNEWKL